MTRILLIETASPLRVCHKLEQILNAGALPRPEISILCRESSRAVFPDQRGITVYPFADGEGHRLPEELNRKKFDTIYVFWTGERRYRRIKLLALRLNTSALHVIAGDGNEFRLTWKAFCRHALFRWKHPLPTDHWDFVLPETKPDQAIQQPFLTDHGGFVLPGTKPDQIAMTDYPGEQILILQSAEPPHVLQSLDRLRERPLFRNPRYTLFCRNRPEIVDSFRNHPLLAHILIHSEAKDSWKHLRELRRSRFDAMVLYLTGDPGYWKLKLFALLLGVPPRRTLIFNESIECFFFNWSQWFALILHRMQSRPIPQVGSKWSHSAHILVSLVFKSVVLPFRFFWLLLVWLRLRSAGLRYSRKNPNDSLRLPLFPGI
jgi:hypothetical protein